MVGGRAVSFRFGALALALCAALGCSTYSTYKSAPIDCSVMNAYDLDVVDSEFMMTYGASDHTTDAGVTPKVEGIPGGPLCGDATALHVVGASYNDWGSLFGFYGFGNKDESAREGMSFWARAPGNGQKGITILLDDPNTFNPNANCPASADAGAVTIIPPGDGGNAYCTTYCTPDAGAVTASPPAYDPSNGMPLSSGSSTAPLPENACSNSYQTEISLTADWAFYTIPFSQFQQQATPDRVPNSTLSMVGSSPQTKMLTSSISKVTFRLPKGSPYELWFDRLGFYGKKRGSDGGGQ